MRAHILECRRLTGVPAVGNLMIRLLQERLKFFGEIVGALVIDSGFLLAWALIHYAIEYLVAWLWAPHPPYIILIPKYVLEYPPLVVISFFVLVDVTRSLRKSFDLLVEALSKREEELLQVAEKAELPEGGSKQAAGGSS